MSEREERRPMHLVEVSSEGEVRPAVEVPDLNELLGDRVEGMSHEARTFLKLQMLLRDQDFIGRMNNHESIFAMFQDMMAGGYLPREAVVDAYQTIMATWEDFKRSVAAEAGIPVPTADVPNNTGIH
jgi:hypothetical protein